MKAKANKNKVTVTWKKIKKTKKAKKLLVQIKSIQVQCSTDPRFASGVNAKKVGKKKTKAVLKLKRKTTYYVRVRYVVGRVFQLEQGQRRKSRQKVPRKHDAVDARGVKSPSVAFRELPDFQLVTRCARYASDYARWAARRSRK